MKEYEVVHHHRLRQDREAREEGWNGVENSLEKIANRPDAVKFRAIVCGCKVLCHIECCLHALTKVKQRLRVKQGKSIYHHFMRHIDPFYSAFLTWIYRV
jgi:hypothetical protein